MLKVLLSISLNYFVYLTNLFLSNLWNQFLLISLDTLFPHYAQLFSEVQTEWVVGVNWSTLLYFLSGKINFTVLREDNRKRLDNLKKFELIFEVILYKEFTYL